MIAGIETGGTKIVCAVAHAGRPDKIVESWTFPTTDPATSYERVVDALSEHDIESIGLASFGPVNVSPQSADFGTMQATPKAGWSGFDQRAALERLGVPAFAVVSDVTGAAIGERFYGAGVRRRGEDTDSSTTAASSNEPFESIAYVTVGTGIGVGAIVGGTPVSGLGHPELGHILVRRHPRDTFGGNCPFHADCLEGLASGPAVHERWGVPADRLEGLLDDAVEILSWYIAQLMMTITLSLCPERIVFGGGVSKVDGLIDAVRTRAAELMANYLPGHPIADSMSEFVTPPSLADTAGVVGALRLADDALNAHNDRKRPTVGVSAATTDSGDSRTSDGSSASAASGATRASEERLEYES